MTKLPNLIVVAVLLGVAAGVSAPYDMVDPEAQVEKVERAFARTMADRNFEAFQSFLSEEATFLSGSTLLRGKDAVSERWAAFYEEEQPPFSWEPETVSVLDSGKLALSTGPVRNSAGERVATFTSIWRQESPGVWRIVFDRGNPYCE